MQKKKKEWNPKIQSYTQICNNSIAFKKNQLFITGGDRKKY